MGDVGSRGKVDIEKKVDILSIIMDLIEKEWTMDSKSVSTTCEMGTPSTETIS